MNSVAELLNEGLSITLIGMGVVFVLLTALVGIVHAMSAFCRRFPDSLAEAAAVQEPSETPTTELELIGVVGVAIHAYRRRAEQRQRAASTRI